MDDDPLDDYRREQEERERQWEKERRRIERDQAALAYMGLGFFFLGIGLTAWLVWGYLESGLWPRHTLRGFFHLQFDSPMIGLNNVMYWLFDQWVGWYAFAASGLFFWASTQD